MTTSKQIRLGLITVVVGFALTFGAYLNVIPRLFSGGGETVSARFAFTGDLAAGDPVRIDGVDVGEVKDISLDDGGRSATVSMTVRKAGQAVFAGAGAAIWWRTLLGGNSYVELSPGRRGAQLGSRTIPPSRTTTQVEIDDVTHALRGSARTGLRSTLRELAVTLRRPQPVRRALRAIGDASPDLADGVGALQGTREGDLGALVRSTAAAVRALDAPAQPARALVENAARMLAVTGRREADLQRALRLAPRALRQAVATLRPLDGTLAAADPVVSRLRATTVDLAPGARSARVLLTQTDGLLREADPLVRSLRPAVSELAAASRNASPLIDDLMPSLARLDERLLPGLDKRDPVSRRKTYQMVGPTAAAIANALAQFDGEGHWLRFPSLGTANTFEDVPCHMLISDPEKRGQIARCNVLVRAFKELLSPKTKVAR